MKIVLLEDLSIPKETLEKYQKEIRDLGHEFISFDKSIGDEEQIKHAKDADIIMLANTPLSGKVIENLPNLKYIDIAFTGVDHVDIKTAKDKDILVSNAAGYSTESVAELSIALMIMLLRNIPENIIRTRNSKTKDLIHAKQLNTQTVGIIGVGTIGKRVAQLLNSFGSKILGYKRNVSNNEPEYIEFVDLDTLLKNSDIITLHVPGNESTKDLINKETIKKMKDDVILINTARGSVVNSTDLVEALKSGKIAGAGIDVYDYEPALKSDDIYLEAPNTILTPHIGFYSEEAMLKRAEIVFDNIKKYLENNPQNLV